MTTLTSTSSTNWLPLRFALRELRGGLRGFYVFIACIALGVMAIAGVASVSASLSEGLARQGRVLLGGDASFALIQREATPDERAFLDRQGQVSVATTMRGMVRAASGELTLVDIKAVDDAYPMLGNVTLEPASAMRDALAERDGRFGAAADPLLLARLGVKVGDVVTLGNASFVIRSVVSAEPDKLLGGISLGPRFLISTDALRATGLLQPGSLVRWTYRVKLGTPTDSNIQTLIDNSRQQFPQAGWEVRSPANASPQLERSITRFTQFLTLVGLAALLIGGVGVINAVQAHLDQRREVIATLKALGASARVVFNIYLAQVMLLAALGTVIGAAIGAGLPYLVVALFGSHLPLPLAPAIYPSALAIAFAYGVLAALAFALWPLARVQEVPVAALFREGIEARTRWPQPRFFILNGLALGLLIAAAIGFAYDRRVAAIFVVSSIGAFILLRLIAVLLMQIAKRLPRSRFTMLRLAIANIHRPGALTPSVVMSLGLGLAALVTVTQIEGNLRQQFAASLPEHAPSFYFIDIPSTDSDRFTQFLKDNAAGATIETVPMLRGRIVAAKGIRAEDLKPSPDVEWVLQSDRGLTVADEIPRGSKAEGEWWPRDYQGPPQVSMEKKIAEGFGLKLGDEITVNVLGRDVTARIGNLRTVDWQSLGINFVLVFSPNTFAGAPHTDIATLTADLATTEDDAKLIKAVAASFPSVTSVRVRDALQSVGAVVNNLVLGIRGASLVTLLSAILVLGGALAAGHRHRVYDAVILKTLGATRAKLIGAYTIEYGLIGLATALFGTAAGSVAAWQIVTRLMSLSFTWQAASAGLVILTALLLTISLGLIGTLLALNQKPAAVLRDL